jgi:MIP family channel proteins
MNPKLLKQCVAEFIGTFALVFVGVGAIYHTSGFDRNAGLVVVALAHGLTIAVMASAVGAISGGQFNPAVTFALWIGGKMNVKDSIAFVIAQLAGASAAGFVLVFLFANQTQLANSILVNGTPNLPKAGVTSIQAILIEAILTFFLVFVIYGTAVDNRGPKGIAGLAIGFTVALDILFGGPLTGAAMNPARVFGPSLASGDWSNHIVYWIGPLLGAALAGLVYGRFLIKEERS